MFYYILVIDMETKGKKIKRSDSSAEDLEDSDRDILLAEIKRLRSELKKRDQQISDLSHEMAVTVDTLNNKLNENYSFIEELKETINRNVRSIKDLEKKLHLVTQLNIKSVSIRIETENEEIILKSHKDGLYVSQGNVQNTALEERLKYENNLLKLEQNIREMKEKLLEKERENDNNTKQRMEIEQELKVKDKVIHDKQMQIDEYFEQLTRANTQLNRRRSCCFVRCLAACFGKRS